MSAAENIPQLEILQERDNLKAGSLLLLLAFMHERE